MGSLERILAPVAQGKCALSSGAEGDGDLLDCLIRKYFARVQAVELISEGDGRKGWSQSKGRLSDDTRLRQKKICTLWLIHSMERGTRNA